MKLTNKQTHYKKFSKTIHEVADKNEDFLLQNSKDVFDEIVELVNDAIDYAQSYAKRDKDERKKLHAESAMNFYACNSLMPSSNALLVDLLTGNLPACFRELRFMIEMLAKCYLADSRYAQLTFFEQRLYTLQHTKDGKRIPEIRLVEDFSKEIEDSATPLELWRSLSEEAHARKFVERVVDSVINRDNVPAYSLAIPMVLKKGDLHDIRDLNRYVVSFRGILNKTLNNDCSGTQHKKTV